MEFLALWWFGRIIGIAAGWYVLKRRDGFSEVKARAGVDWREFVIANPGYFALTFLKFVFWEVTLVVWLVNGRPESRWQAVVELDGREVRAVTRV